MMKFKKQLMWFVMLFTICSISGLQAQNVPAHAITGVTIHHADGQTQNSSTIVWRDGVIEAVGRNIEIPFDAFTIDGGDSLHIYPGFIDGLSHWGAPDLPERFSAPDIPGEPGYERAGIQADRHPNTELDYNHNDFENTLKNGITAAAIALKGFMLPGHIDFFFLNEEQTSDHLFEKSLGQVFTLESAPGGWTSRAYPNTTMGVMARFRQLMYDAESLEQHMAYFASADGHYPAPKRDDVLESLIPAMNGNQPFFAAADTPEDIERLLILKDEFDLDMILISGKEAWLKADELASRDIPVLVSFDLPEQPKWMKDDAEEDSEDPVSDEELQYRERQQKAYNQRIQNVRKLLDAGITVGFASFGMELKDFKPALETLNSKGDLSDNDILQVLTLNTAKILGFENLMGSLRQGHIAGFTVYDKPLFEEETERQMTISNGVIHEN